MTGRDYVCGARFTAADVYVGSHIAFGLRFGGLPARDAFDAYVERLTARPNYQRANALDNSLLAENR